MAFTPEKSQQFLQKVADAVQTAPFQAEISKARQAFTDVPAHGKKVAHDIFGALAELLPDFGYEPSATVLLQRMAAARKDLERSPAHTTLLQKIIAFERALDGVPDNGNHAEAHAAGSDGSTQRLRLRSFLQRFNLGPPGGFSTPGSETEGEGNRSRAPDKHSSSAPKASDADLQDLRSAKAMLRRISRRQVAEPSCEVELCQVGEPITLFTKPTCTITFYSNSRQLVSTGPGLVAPRPIFAIAIASSACAKTKAAQDWEFLKGRLTPILQVSAFYLLQAARAVLPKALASVPAHAAVEQDEAFAEELVKLEEGAIDYERCCETHIQDTEERQRRCEAARCERRSFLVRHFAAERFLARSRDIATPWKKLGNDAFKRGDYFTAMTLYSRCMEAMEEGEREERAAIFSNRAACFAKVCHYEDSKADAKAALELRPTWARAWTRLGHAADCLGQVQEAVDAYLQAVTFEPTHAHVSALAEVVVKKGSDPEVAHSSKEKGNVAMRNSEFGLAVAQYTYCIALLPPDPRILNPTNGADDHCFLRSVLYSNRSAAFSRLKNWTCALADARQAVASKEDFVTAHIRLGTALLGEGLTEQAYGAFARALVHEADCSIALKGRQACLTSLPCWASNTAKLRLQDRFGSDLCRPSGSTKVYAISDVHFDHKCNEEWAHRIDDFKFQEDVLIVAGNMCDTRNGLLRAFTTLKAKFRRIFWVPGNHEMWLHPSEASKYPDTFAKLMSMLEACDELGIDVFPAAVAQDVFIVPLFSWYNSEFDTDDPFPDPTSKTDQHCRWPIPDTQVWRYMLKMNAAHLDRPYHGTVISFSHFLPHGSLPYPTFGGGAKAMGCAELDDQVQRIRGASRVHVYGHSHRRNVQQNNGVWYINHFHGEEGGKEDRAPLFLIHDGHFLAKRAEDIFDGEPRV